MSKVFHSFATMIRKHAKLSISMTLIVTLILGIGLANIKISMGNEIFVSKDSKVYKDTATYQKNFGGDGIYVLLSGNQKDLLSSNNLKKVADFSKKINSVDNVKGSMNLVSVMNEQFKNAGTSSSDLTSSAKLQTGLMNSLTTKQKEKLTTKVNSSLNATQTAALQKYTVGLLSTSQQAAMAQKIQAGATSQEALTSSLSHAQTNEIQAYMLSQLTSQQKQSMQTFVVGMLPKVQNMDSDLVHDLVFSDNGKMPAQLNQLLPNNAKNMLLVVNTSDKTDMNSYVKLSKETNKIIKAEHFSKNVKVRLAGGPAVNGQVNDVVVSTMSTMFGLAVVLMIVILASVFPVRRRLLSLLFVTVGLIWTFGIIKNSVNVGNYGDITYYYWSWN